MAMKRFDVELRKDGRIHDERQVTALLDGLQGVSDLIVAAHGWNNDLADARALYDELLGNVDSLLDARGNTQAPAPLKALSDRTFAACQLFWPSKKFTDEELIPGGGAATAAVADSANDRALNRTLDELGEDPERLGQKRTPTVRRRLVDRAKQLATQVTDSESARREYLAVLRSLLDPDQASGDDASDDFFTEDAEALFKRFEAEVIAPGATGGGGAGTVGGGGTAGTGGAAGIRDAIKGARAAARRLANFATYYQMKTRAGTVGSTGAAAVVRRLRARHARITLHLVGHSFGGRLVTAAAHALDDDTPAISLCLLQAAFSHNGLSADFGDGEPGFYRDVIAMRRASGPIIITHTKNDSAVGVAYPLASRIAFQKASALGDANDPYGGMGRNGAQRTSEVHAAEATLEQVGHGYDGLARGRVCNLLADTFIKDHNDVRGPQVAYAILCTAGKV
jgi:hypothetical protein